MRYSQESTSASPLNLESSAQSSTVINLYPSGQPPVFNQTTTYQPESGGPFYSATSSHLFSNLDVRSRLETASSTSAPGIAHAHRPQLPHPGAQLSARELYSTATPSFRRAGEHSARSPPFPGSLRHHPLSPTPSPSQTYTAPFKMDAGTFGGQKPQIPPLMDTTTFGTIQYSDGPGAGHSVKLDINGTIDKGFFLADKEWTCYRRNYFSCICSFSFTPHYPSSGMTFVQNNGTRSHTVHGFAMSISAVVSDNDNHVIDLVQHTPKRDKGPTARPEKVRLVAKPPQPTHHTIGMYGTDNGMPVASRYDHAYGPPQTGYPSEHTFERIQFKQATANNGKRRAAQQYYHLLVELWADVGPAPGSEHYIKIAHRKSAKMIVRGRSPGHYQSERRGSTSSGPGGSAGSLGFGGSQVMGSDFGSTGSGMLPGTYGSAYDPRSTSHYGSGSRHQHQQHQYDGMSIDHPIMTSDEVKAIAETKDYQYFPAPICDSSQDPRQPVEMFSHSHQRGEHDNVLPHMDSSGFDSIARIKHEASNEGLPNLFYAGSSFYSHRCGRYEGKTSSGGYYPSVVAPTTSISLS